MWPSHLEDLYKGMVLPDGSQPFIFNEVIDLGGEAISASEYTHLGRITEFKYCNHMFGAFRNHFPLSNLHRYFLTLYSHFVMLTDITKCIYFIITR